MLNIADTRYFKVHMYLRAYLEIILYIILFYFILFKFNSIIIIIVFVFFFRFKLLKQKICLTNTFLKYQGTFT